MKQTAVEWLVEQMNNIKGSSISMNGRVQFIEKELNNLFEQAKEMEKEQIIDAYGHGQNNGYVYAFDKAITINREQYYNETYGK